MKVDFTKLVGFTVAKVRETDIKSTTTCCDCDCEDATHTTVVSFVNDCDVQQDVIFEDGRAAFMSEPFCTVEDDE